MAFAPREVVSVDVPVEPETVWDHLRTPALVRRWYGWDRDTLAADIRRTFVVEAVEQYLDVPGVVLRQLRWHNHDLLEVRSHGHLTHTRVTLRRSDLALLASYDGVRDHGDETWIMFLHQLEFALTVHPGEDRRTLAVHHLDAGPHSDTLLYRVGLHGAWGVPLGGALEAHRPDGSMAGGTLLYRTPFQVGIQLHGVAESLLVVQRAPPASHPPHGTISAVLSTYGLDDETWELAQEHWAHWWPVEQVAAPHTDPVIAPAAEGHGLGHRIGAWARAQR
jgi:hypothetical protein